LFVPDRAVGQPSPIDVVLKAVQAQGGQAALQKYRAGYIKTRGTLAEGGVSFAQEAYYQVPNLLRQATDIATKDQQTHVLVVLNGDKAWINRNGETGDLKDPVLAELREAANLLQMTRLVDLLDDKIYTMEMLPPIQVDGRPAFSMAVRRKGFGDVNLYFARDTGLLLKTERSTWHAPVGKNVLEERILSDYRETQGVPTARKITVKHDSKTFMDIQLVEIRYFEGLNENVFARP
jgi:hypothetical protein